MKFTYKTLALSTGLLLGLSACEKDFLERDAPNIVLDEQIWNDATLITSLLANNYDRLPFHSQIDAGWENFAAYDEAIWSGNGDGSNNLFEYGFSRWEYWDYGLIRDINLALENIDKFSTTLPEVQKAQFKAEFRFLRAYVYFEMVKRMGGVPIVTQQLIYDGGGDPSSLQSRRNTEAEVYDFIASELDAIKGDLRNDGSIPTSPTSVTRANKYAAMALKSRAMLYAGSIAKYNAQSGLNIQTTGGEVGIPAGRASEYYQKALDAAKEVIAGPYSLYQANPTNLGENFYDAIVRKASNPEVILAKDFLVSRDRRHGFTYDNIARGIREDNLSSSIITPTLNLVESFEYLDGSSGEIRTRNADNTDFIYYDNLNGPFAGKDARLYGTVIYPGTTFAGQDVQIQAGVMVWNAGGNRYDMVEGGLATTYTDNRLLTGSSGPQRAQTEVSNTGFYLRKYIDATPKASTRGIQSDTWWVRFRLGEVLLNASEAALELGLESEALTYVNRVRQRAGFRANSLTSLTRLRLENERRVELAFEDHRVWDLKRWRRAHVLWDGNSANPSALMYALYPYRIVRPGDPRNGKYIFLKLQAPRFRAPRNFRLGNYYSAINQGVLNNNPLLVRNPFQ